MTTKPRPNAASTSHLLNRSLRHVRALLAVALLAGAATFATGCIANDNVQVVNDPFLGPTRGFVMYLDFGGYTGVSMKQAQGKYTLQVMVVEPGVSQESAAVGDKTQFLVGDKVLTLANATAAQPVSNAHQRTIFTQWQLTFHLDDQQAKTFAIAPLNAIKAHVGGHEFQLALPPAKAAKFQQNLGLMTATGNAAPPA